MDRTRGLSTASPAKQWDAAQEAATRMPGDPVYDVLSTEYGLPNLREWAGGALVGVEPDPAQPSKPDGPDPRDALPASAHELSTVGLGEDVAAAVHERNLEAQRHRFLLS